MNPFLWLARARRWVQHPPSMRHVILVFAVIAVALAVYALDRTGLWPDWARSSPQRLRHLWR